MELRPLKQSRERKTEVMVIKMIWWMLGKTDKIRNESKRAKVTEISNKVQESRLKMYGHVIKE